MDYLKHYNRLIARGKLRGWTKETAPCYTEYHHIIPRCVETNESGENKVLLTAEEHFLAHQLLIKIYEGTRYYGYLVTAASLMTAASEGQIRNNKMFGWIRSRMAIAKTKEYLSPETRKKMSENSKRENLSLETRRRISESKKKENLSEETRRKISEAASKRTPPMTGKKHSVDSRQKMSNSHSKENLSAETRKKMSESMKGNKNALGYKHSEESKLKMSESSRKENLSPETRKKMSESSRKENLSAETRKRMRKGAANRTEEHKEKLRQATIRSMTPERRMAISEWHQKQPVLTCPHCGKQSRSKGNMNRYHFDNCKFKDN